MAAAEAVAVGGLLALGVAYALGPGGIDDGPVLCPVRRLTGIECPACGLTRAWVHLVHGDLAASVAANPFGVVLVVGLLVLLALVARARLVGAAAPVVEVLVRRPVVLVVAALWAAWGLARALG